MYINKVSDGDIVCTMHTKMTWSYLKCKRGRERIQNKKRKNSYLVVAQRSILYVTVFIMNFLFGNGFSEEKERNNWHPYNIEVKWQGIYDTTTS